MILIPGMKELESLIPVLLGSMRFGNLEMRQLIRAIQSRGSAGGFRPDTIYTGGFARTVAAGSGTQVITGIPWKAYMIFFLARSTSEIAAGGTSIGFAFDPATGLAPTALQRLTGTGVYWAGLSNAVKVWESGTQDWVGDIASVNNGGFSFTWTMTGTPAQGADVNYAAFRRG